MTRVELTSRLENFHRSSFQTQPPITTARGFTDNVMQKRPRHAFPQVPRSGPHRFDFAMLRVQFLERSAAEQLAIFPNALIPSNVF
jgi:hypothetical protein